MSLVILHPCTTATLSPRTLIHFIYPLTGRPRCVADHDRNYLELVLAIRALRLVQYGDLRHLNLNQAGLVLNALAAAADNLSTLTLIVQLEC